jgi:hypothetical protein
MRVYRDRWYAVLTGDIVRSTALSESGGVSVGKLVRDAAARMKKMLDGSVEYEVSAFRGDGWQLFVPRAELSIRAALFMRAALLAARKDSPTHTRCAVGIGRITNRTGTSITEWSGPAFTMSGRALDRAASDERLTVACADPEIGETLNVLAQLIELGAGRWSSRQAQSLCGALGGLTQKEIALHQWKGRRTQQAVQQHLRSAGWGSIQRGLEYSEALIKQGSRLVITRNKGKTL